MLHSNHWEGVKSYDFPPISFTFELRYRSVLHKNHFIHLILITLLTLSTHSIELNGIICPKSDFNIKKCSCGAFTELLSISQDKKIPISGYINSMLL